MDEVLSLFRDNLPDAAYEYLKPGVINYFPKEQEVHGDGEIDGIHLLIEYFLGHYEIDRAEIICFGNNLYGREVINLWENHPYVKIDLMVCSPTVSIIHEHDKNTLNKKIKMAVENQNTAILAAESPPTLRSCVLFSHDKPILCCMQHYVISMLEERLPSFKGRQTPCIMLYRYNDCFPMVQYVGFCRSEYERLKTEDAYTPVINEKTGEVERPKTEDFDY